MRGATLQPSHQIWMLAISIHTPHAGSDRQFPTDKSDNADFNPHSPCGERPIIMPQSAFMRRISIHTPHAGSDFSATRTDPPPCISIHTPHAGSDLWEWMILTRMWKFQSTLPMRGATGDLEGDLTGVTISIHTPHAGSDKIYGNHDRCSSQFQSTLPMRGATHKNPSAFQFCDISIHTPHAGSDTLRSMFLPIPFISIHTPHAGSDKEPATGKTKHRTFQSTLPMRGATIYHGH